MDIDSWCAWFRTHIARHSMKSAKWVVILPTNGNWAFTVLSPTWCPVTGITWYVTGFYCGAALTINTGLNQRVLLSNFIYFRYAQRLALKVNKWRTFSQHILTTTKAQCLYKRSIVFVVPSSQVSPEPPKSNDHLNRQVPLWCTLGYALKTRQWIPPA